MNWFKKLRIEVKFISAFILVSTVGLAVGITGIRNMANVNEMADQIYEKELLGLSYLKEANINLIYMARAEKNAILATTEQDRLGFVDRAKKSEVIYQDYLQRAKPLFYTERGKEGFAKVEKAWGEYITVHKQVLDLALTEKLSEKKASSDLSMGLARQKIEILDKVLTDLTREKEANAKGLSDASTHLYESSRTIMIILTIVGFFAGIGLGIVMTLSVTRPIKRIIDGLSEGADQVSAASGQVSSASGELAEGASEQAASIEETSSSLEEMAAMTKQNADNAGQANQLMVGTRDTVARASLSMDRLTTSMGEISRASEETSKIIKTIDEIAFQTNLLALNAAVEAARAGEAGAGFAVVANEVRNLAMRAAEAAKNTATLIEGTVKKVKEGSELVEMTEKEFREVAASVGRSGELVGEISAASVEQAQGIAQVNKAVSEMDKVVQQNASNAEESASASEEMNAQAAQMKDFVSALASLIGGRNGHSTLKITRKAERRDYTGPGFAPSARAALPSARRNSSGHGTGVNGKVPALPVRTERTPAQVIPFDESDGSQF